MNAVMNAINAEASVRVSVPSIIEGTNIKIMQPTGRPTKRYEAGTSASAAEHSRGGASKSRLRDIVTNAAIDLTDIKPEGLVIREAPLHANCSNNESCFV